MTGVQTCALPISGSYAINTTTELGVILFGTTSTNRTLTIYINDTVQSSHFTTPLVALHDSLAGLQGGTANEYYHLTQAEYSILHSTGGVGYVGSFGYTGSIGYTGSAGYAGSQGTTGYAGSIGYTGSFGSTGYTGSTGSQGTTGYTGSTGSQGTTGFTGSTGSQGTTGYTGSVG